MCDFPDTLRDWDTMVFSDMWSKLEKSHKSDNPDVSRETSSEDKADA